jgi:hypothetical protein
VTFIEAGLPLASSDCIVWRFAQAHTMLLLTGNRNMDGKNSLEQTIRDENHPAALPIVTIGSLDQIEEIYRDRT